MELLATINPEGVTQNELKDFVTRSSARAIVFDDTQNIAVLNVTKGQYHKLPGGGVEEGESIVQALHRECLEEIGCDIEIKAELGKVVEYRQESKLVAESFYFIASMKGIKGTPTFTDSELSKGFNVQWLPLDEVINLIKGDSPTDYTGKFIVQRDLVFLEKAKTIPNIL